MFLQFFKWFKEQNSRVFLDYAGATPVSSSVKREMQKYDDVFANPSGLYRESIQAKETISSFRQRIAKTLNVNKNEIIFTSGGTESNNLAIRGVYEYFKSESFVPHFITINTEHSSVLEVFKEIQKSGGEVTILEVEEDGRVSVNKVLETVKSNTVLISISLANSEIGVVQPISEISKSIKEKRGGGDLPYIHSDCSGASVYLSLDPNSLGADLISLDAGKIYGPKGIGLLFVNSGTKIKPIILGGGQEKGLRSGTENLVSIAGFAKALEDAISNRIAESKRLEVIRDYAIKEIQENFPNAILNGSKKHRLPNNINFCFPGLDAEFAVVSLDLLGFSLSYSSSCLTLKDDFSSYVIRALNKNVDCSKSSLRITLGKGTTSNDIDRLIIALKKVVIK